MLQIPGATSYIGCIGKDKFGEEMKKKAKDSGVNVSSFSYLGVYIIQLFSAVGSCSNKLFP